MDKFFGGIKPLGVRYGVLAGIIIGVVPLLLWCQWLWNAQLGLEFPATCLFVPCFILPVAVTLLVVGQVPNIAIGTLVGWLVEKLHSIRVRAIGPSTTRLALASGLIGLGITLPVFLLLILVPMFERYLVFMIVTSLVFLWAVGAAMISFFISRYRKDESREGTNNNA